MSDQHQRIHSIRCSVPSASVYSDEKYSTPALVAEFGSNGGVLEFSFGVHRQAVSTPVVVVDKSVDIDPSAFSLALEGSSKMPLNVVRMRAEIATKGAITPLGKARQIYDWICDFMARDPNCVGCGDGDVCVLLDTKMGKCTDIHSVFVALCRASGVPAREVFGIRMACGGSEDSVNVTQWQHCWVEFFVPLNGWLVCDPSDVLKDALAQKLDKSSPEFRALKERYWLQIDPFRVAIARGRDLLLNPAPESGATINTFQYPMLEQDGVLTDSVRNVFYKITFQRE